MVMTPPGKKGAAYMFDVLAVMYGMSLHLTLLQYTAPDPAMSRTVSSFVAKMTVNSVFKH